jgi:hypothetical protein
VDGWWCKVIMRAIPRARPRAAGGSGCRPACCWRRRWRRLRGAAARCCLRLPATSSRPAWPRAVQPFSSSSVYFISDSSYKMNRGMKMTSPPVARPSWPARTPRCPRSAAARSQCSARSALYFALPLIHFIPDSRRGFVPLSLKRQCDRPLGLPPPAPRAAALPRRTVRARRGG